MMAIPRRPGDASVAYDGVGRLQPCMLRYLNTTQKEWGNTLVATLQVRRQRGRVWLCANTFSELGAPLEIELSTLRSTLPGTLIPTNTTCLQLHACAIHVEM